ncbi:hypothetical protein [Caulobacter sp. Root487D2Y]|uniref:hypothetical protein n=1 Tax=Caulobacter sp. Root487D2Y TaxID=1736547 RepID=UPI0012E39127|nr:hypothetical protein [Caulobacter sp. Root487D2Y]
MKSIFFLQIRLICEIITIGCVIAHGEIEKANSKRLQKRWSAADIIVELEKITPDFYPSPFIQLRTTHILDGKPVEGWHFEERKPDFLTKEELLALYGRCGDRLHRGSVKSIVANKPYKTSELSDLVDIIQKLVNLVCIHRIQILNGDAQLLCIMYPDNSDEVSVMVGYAEDGKISEQDLK